MDLESESEEYRNKLELSKANELHLSESIAKFEDKIVRRDLFVCLLICKAYFRQIIKNILHSFIQKSLHSDEDSLKKEIEELTVKCENQVKLVEMNEQNFAERAHALEAKIVDMQQQNETSIGKYEAELKAKVNTV